VERDGGGSCRSDALDLGLGRACAIAGGVRGAIRPKSAPALHALARTAVNRELCELGRAIVGISQGVLWFVIGLSINGRPKANRT
jgi:hypothetical protein